MHKTPPRRIHIPGWGISQDDAEEVHGSQVGSIERPLLDYVSKISSLIAVKHNLICLNFSGEKNEGYICSHG